MEARSTPARPFSFAAPRNGSAPTTADGRSRSSTSARHSGPSPRGFAKGSPGSSSNEPARAEAHDSYNAAPQRYPRDADRVEVAPDLRDLAGFQADLARLAEEHPPRSARATVRCRPRPHGSRRRKIPDIARVRCATSAATISFASPLTVTLAAPSSPRAHPSSTAGPAASRDP